jgi:hypothetical protein
VFKHIILSISFLGSVVQPINAESFSMQKTPKLNNYLATFTLNGVICHLTVSATDPTAAQDIIIKMYKNQAKNIKIELVP